MRGKDIVSNSVFIRKAILSISIILLLISGCILRFYHFPMNPPSLNWDEVSFGYNAYSLLKTGKDEFGKFFPSSFRSLDDYKLPVYMYATVLSEAIFGMNDFAVRFPSALSGILTVVIVYLMVKELNKKNTGKFSYVLPILSAVLLLILPWHVQFSRMAAEANMGLFFFTSAVYTFLIARNRSPWVFVLSVLLFGFAMYTYLSFLILSIIAIPFLFFYNRKQIFQKKLPNLFAIILLAILLVLLIRGTLTQGVHIRFNATSIFTQTDLYKHTESEMFVDAGRNINIARRIFHDSPIFTSCMLISRGYLSHFSPDFLFFDLNQKHHHAPLTGLVYLWIIPFFFIGVLYLYQKNKGIFWLMMIWLLISPIPASVTWDVPHAIRSVGMVVPIAVFSAAGILSFLTWTENLDKIQVVCIGAGLFITVGLFTYQFFHQYDIHLPYERSDLWVYGRKEMVAYIRMHENIYDRIIISTKLEWPYIFLLYYLKYDPYAYLKDGGTVSGGWGEEGNKFGKYEFHKFNADPKTVGGERILYIGEPDEFTSAISPLYVVKYLSNAPAIYFIEK